MYAAPILLADMDAVPHQHVLIGAVGRAELDAHLAAERANAPLSNTLAYRNGFIVSVLFGDWSNYWARFSMLLDSALPVLGITHVTARLGACDPPISSPFLISFDPPPRLA